MADLECFRGEKNNDWPTQNWPKAELRLIDGLTVRRPLPGGESPRVVVKDVWAAVVKEIEKEIGRKKSDKVNAYTQTLRQSGSQSALATARSGVGSYTADSNYVILVQNARTFRWAADLGLGEEVPWVTDTAQINDHYIVLNSDALATSTVFAVGHRTGTLEVTFFTDVPRAWVRSVNGQPLSEVAVRDKKALGDLDTDSKIALNKLLRR